MEEVLKDCKEAIEVMDTGLAPAAGLALNSHKIMFQLIVI